MKSDYVGMTLEELKAWKMHYTYEVADIEAIIAEMEGSN